jgi:carboxypeptidase Taq
VERGLIRIDADEVTYPAHILLRYDMERDLVCGKLEVEDLPEAWDAAMQALLGLSTSGNDREGCLQDIHWPIGAFGYFPLYTVGAMVAAQLFSAVSAQIPELASQLENGNFDSLNTWLAKAIWSRASSVTLDQMLLDATGEELNPQKLMGHLKSRYLP